MSSKFVNVLRQSFKTFDRSNQAAFNSNLALLKQLTEQLTFRHLQLNQEELLNDDVFSRPGHAPCTYIHIFENCNVSLSVFILRKGYTMPLHDHPMMFGLLRGIYGQLHVQSYTQKFGAIDKIVSNCGSKSIPAIAEEPLIISVNTECAVLTPYERNFHEITAVDGVAAFFDILSPPYHVMIPEYGVRKCNFYRVTSYPGKNESDDKAKIVLLEHVIAPFNYYCDTASISKEIEQCTFQFTMECLKSS